MGERAISAESSWLAGRYRVEREIGQGAHGRVFLATDTANGGRVALKRFAESTQDDTFLRELGAVFDLRHSAIVHAESVLVHEGYRYLVYEYMELGSIRERINRGADARETLALVQQAARGVAHAHSRNVLHRDLKPENILVTRREGRLEGKVTDFGVSVLGVDEATRSNTGSPAYMAPEQFYDAYDLRVDVYSLGVVIYEVLLGKRPFGGTPAQIMLAHLERDVAFPDDFPPKMGAVLARCLAKKPEQRFASVADLLSELDEALAIEAQQLGGDLWPLYVPDAEAMVMTSSALLVRTGSDVTRNGPRGDMLDVHHGVAEMLARGDYFALRQGGEVAVWSAQSPVRALRVPVGAALALSANGTLASLHDNRLKLATPGDVRRTSMAPTRRVSAVDFIGRSERLATVSIADHGSIISLGKQEVHAAESLDRIWVHDSGQSALMRVRGKVNAFLCLKDGAIEAFAAPCPISACDGRRVYGVTQDGQLFMLDLETMHHAITRFEMPLRSVAASSEGLAWLAKNGTIDRIQTTGREA